MALRSFHFFFSVFSCNLSSARAHKSTSSYHRQPNKKRNPAGFFACKYSHCIDLYSFNTFSCITKRRSQQRPATMCIHESTSNVDGEGGDDDGGRTQSSLQRTAKIYIHWIESHSLISMRTWGNAPCLLCQFLHWFGIVISCQQLIHCSLLTYCALTQSQMNISDSDNNGIAFISARIVRFHSPLIGEMN